MNSLDENHDPENIGELITSIQNNAEKAVQVAQEGSGTQLQFIVQVAGYSFLDAVSEALNTAQCTDEQVQAYNKIIATIQTLNQKNAEMDTIAESTNE